MAIDQTCTMTITGEKDSPDQMDIIFDWNPVLDTDDNDNNHKGVVSAFSDCIDLIKQSDGKVEVVSIEPAGKENEDKDNKGER